MLLPTIFLVAVWAVFIICLIPIFKKYRYSFYLQMPNVTLPRITLPSSPVRTRARSKNSKANKSKQNLNKGVNYTTRSKLLDLVQGDSATASRLVEHVQNRNPGKSLQWCWEKAIWDLERDRY